MTKEQIDQIEKDCKAFPDSFYAEVSSEVVLEMVNYIRELEKKVAFNEVIEKLNGMSDEEYNVLVEDYNKSVDKYNDQQ